MKKNTNTDVKKTKPPFYKRWWFWVIVVVVIIAIIGSIFGGNDEETEIEETTVEETTAEQESHIYDDAEICELLSGSGASIGEYSLIETESSEITMDVLEDWYFNYVENEEYDYYVILYTDKDDNSGIHATAGSVSVNVILKEGSNGALQVSDSSSATLYFPSNGSLVEYQEDDTTEDSTEETEEETESDVTLGMSNALQKALDYLDYTAFSYTGLIEQLEYEGYTEEEATYAVDNCGADWYEQAVIKAEQYLDYTSFSKSGLIEQLEYDGFTTEQAEYAVEAVGY